MKPEVISVRERLFAVLQFHVIEIRVIHSTHLTCLLAVVSTTSSPMLNYNYNAQVVSRSQFLSHFRHLVMASLFTVSV